MFYFIKGAFVSSIILDIIYGAAYESVDPSLAVHRVVGLHATGPGTPYDTFLVSSLTSSPYSQYSTQ